jgi:hypothetical protein
VHPSTQDPEAQADPNTWITEVQTYLNDNILPDDQEARKARIMILGSTITPEKQMW